MSFEHFNHISNVGKLAFVASTERSHNGFNVRLLFPAVHY